MPSAPPVQKQQIRAALTAFSRPSASAIALTVRRIMTSLLARTPYAAGILVVCLFLFRRYQRFRFFARLLAYIITLTISCIVGITVSPFMWAVGQPGLINWIVGKTFLTLGSFATGLRFKVEGKEHLQNTPLPSVLVCNHQTSLDLLSMGTVMPRNCVVMGKKSIKYLPILGWFMALANNVFIDRKNRGHAIETMAKVAVYLEEHKYGLWLFPEGTRSHQKDDTLLPFKKGAFHLAVQGQIPVIPIVISTYAPVYNESQYLFEAGEITVRVLPPIQTKGLTSADVDKLLNDTRDAMGEALRSIKSTPSKRLPPPPAGSKKAVKAE
ncbi:hypothetical protein DFS34DRAFT_617616 [Phlyctochytrium arcticum]|nr:hypothetical protein DFS34DRAFT_617616 [Phlyctochytrium arcticum]